MKHIKKYNERTWSYGSEGYEVIDRFLEKEIGDYSNPIDQEDISDILYKFGKVVWDHLSEEGWGSTDEETYKKWLNNYKG